MSEAIEMATELRALLSLKTETPERLAAALVGGPVDPAQAFDVVRRRGMELAPLPEPKGGKTVAWLKAVWATRQAFGRAFAVAYLAESAS